MTGSQKHRRYGLLPAALLLIPLLGACHGPPLQDGWYACDPAVIGACPSGMECLWSAEDGEYRCFVTSSDDDGGTGPDAGGCNSGNCSGCCDTSGICRLGTEDTRCGTGGQACEDCVTLSQTCVDNACHGGSCDCTSGPCCDGCNYRPGNTLCDTAPVATEYRCEGTDCGADAQERNQYRFCTGTSADCNNDNLDWGTWNDIQDCQLNQRCRANAAEAHCITCPNGCSDGQCNPDDCGDGDIDLGEDCDSDILGGATCQSLSFDDGVLACNNATCTFDTSGCTTCGDSACDGPYEDTCTCHEDCGTHCGDGCCNGGEDLFSCIQDCGSTACPGVEVGGTCVYLADPTNHTKTDARLVCTGLGAGWDHCSSVQVCQSPVLTYLNGEGCACGAGPTLCACSATYAHVYFHVSDYTNSLFIDDPAIPGCTQGPACQESGSETCGAVLCCR